jgi:hypothetical protein
MNKYTLIGANSLIPDRAIETNSLGKKPLMLRWNSRQWLDKIPKDLRKTSLSTVSVFSCVIGDEGLSLVDEAVPVC